MSEDGRTPGEKIADGLLELLSWANAQDTALRDGHINRGCADLANGIDEALYEMTQGERVL